MKLSEIIPDRDHWIKYSRRAITPEGEWCFCLIGGLCELGTYDPIYQQNKRTLFRSIKELFPDKIALSSDESLLEVRIIRFNDDQSTTYEMVEKVIDLFDAKREELYNNKH